MRVFVAFLQHLGIVDRISAVDGNLQGFLLRNAGDLIPVSALSAAGKNTRQSMSSRFR